MKLKVNKAKLFYVKEKLIIKLKFLYAKLKNQLEKYKQKINIFMTEVSEKIPVAQTSYGDDWEVNAKPKRHLHWILWGVFLFILVFIIWAKFAILDEVTHAEGKVIPSSQIQVIQNLEGGIVKNIYVKEGQIVQKNQVLVQLDPTRFESSYQEGKEKEFALQVKIARLTAQVENKPFIPDSELIKKEPELVKQEQALYESRKNELIQLQESAESLKKQINITEPLIKQGAASEVEVLNLKRSLNEVQSKINGFQSDALDELTKSKADLNSQIASDSAYLDRLQRTTIKSLVKGIVKQIKVNTIGGVVQPGMDLMEIVPLDDTLLVEAKVKPSDIGFLRLGLPATVKITAYDYSIYGGLKGTIEEISADSIIDDKDQKQQSYYLVRVRTHKNYLGTSSQKPLFIIPGMTATVDILTGHKSVLHYILKPLIKAKENALKER